jgi:hypothetical protein
MSFGPAPGPFDEQRVNAKQAELDNQERDREAVSQAKYDDRLRHEQDAATAGNGPGPLERFKRWFSARF